MPWDAKAIQHFHHRLGYSISPADLNLALTANPQTYIQQALSAAQSAVPMPQPPWAFWTLDQYDNNQQFADQILGWQTSTVRRLREAPVRGKIELFWLNHFVTQQEVYGCPSWLWQYHQVIQVHAFGDFRDFVRAIGLTPAMLVYLNGIQNTRIEPNENYARELFELFTLGRDNGYTQTDIVNAARALTGYNSMPDLCGPINYLPIAHDPGSKTIFGQTGNFDYDDLIDLIFSQRAVECSTYICSRIYRHFVSTTIDTDVVNQLAAHLRSNNWRLGSVYERLFSSAHFFSPALYGARIKDPFELFLGEERSIDTQALETDELTLAVGFIAANLGQALFEPPDVAGWPGDRAWITSSLLAVRNEAVQQLLFLSYQASPEQFRTWARHLPIADESDPAEVTRAIVDFVLPQGLPRATDYERATEVLRSEVPSYYFDERIWNLDFEYAPVQIVLLLDYLFRRPEYQLC